MSLHLQSLGHASFRLEPPAKKLPAPLGGRGGGNICDPSSGVSSHQNIDAGWIDRHHCCDSAVEGVGGCVE